ncbi:MAG TPA: efflux RND transporter periplasmic adaptor subunit [Bacteroidales bacterium]|nr:efflux RND transporter periplasmic adaptor subunit [Bacteroidales bacterium]
MKNRIISIIIIVLVLVGAGFMLKRSHEKINAGKANLISSEIVVSAAEVGETSTGTSLNLTGTLNPFTEVLISAQAAGQITSLNAELGQTKSKGSVIATIDNRIKELTVQTSKLNADKQQRDLIRYESLFQGGTMTQQQIEDARMSNTTAQIQLEQAKKQLADATITAPISGIITEKNVEKGAFVNIGSPVVRLLDISRLKIRMYVSESNVYKLSTGDKASVVCEAFPDKTFEGKVTYIASKGDDSHNYPVEVVINNNGKLKAGTFANVTIDIPGKGTALSIPREALLGSSKNAKVYVVKNGKAQIRDILVIGGNEKVLFVSKGLAKGEQVVTAGQINLIDGMTVSIAPNK